jgi:hypothetical protein
MSPGQHVLDSWQAVDHLAGQLPNEWKIAGLEAEMSADNPRDVCEDGILALIEAPEATPPGFDPLAVATGHVEQ